MTHQLPTSLRDDEQALELLSDYFHGSGFTGRHFDGWGTNEPGRFTSDDMVALSFLSVEVPAAAIPGLVAHPDSGMTALLKQIAEGPQDLAAVDPEEITSEWPAWQLWELLREQRGFGPTITSKLLARKTPGLIPVWDTVVGNVVGPSVGFWNWLCSELRRNDCALRYHLMDLHKRAELPAAVTPLRVFDVIAWMEGKGYDMAG